MAVPGHEVTVANRGLNDCSPALSPDFRRADVGYMISIVQSLRVSLCIPPAHSPGRDARLAMIGLYAARNLAAPISMPEAA